MRLFHSPCFYCGRSDVNQRKYRGSEFGYSGIDRIDSDRGYVPDNVVACCKPCNYAKNKLSQIDFFNLIGLIAKRHMEGNQVTEKQPNETQQGFDTARQFQISILSGGEKACVVRYPTDEEWCAWARAQRTVRHFLGRGKSHSEDVDLPKINAELFAKIRIDKDGPEFDDAEAGMVIGRIERCAVATVEREGINYRIEMKVPGARVGHVLRMPTAKEMQDHERGSTSVVAARRSVETRAFLEPSGALYDKLHISHDGYSGAVPIVHKSAAVSEVIAQLAIEADEDPE